jgi:general stress protein YciG
MAGTRRGGLKAAKANRERYGDDYYKGIGTLGGQKSRGGGFANNPELARRAGQIGGKISRKPVASSKKSS